MKRFGYIGMTADGIHIGHINALLECKKYCSHLIVGIMTDDCVEGYKGKRPLMNQYERRKVVDSLIPVGHTIFQDTFEFPSWVLSTRELWQGEFIIFDCTEHSRMEADILIARTKGISSTQLKEQDDYFNIGQRSL